MNTGTTLWPAGRQLASSTAAAPGSRVTPTFT